MNSRLTRRRFLRDSLATTTISLTSLQTVLAAGKKIKLYNWDTYMGETTLADFKKVSGIEVEETIFDNVRNASKEIGTGKSGYDLFVPSHDDLKQLIDAQALLPLKRKWLPNFKNLAPEWQSTVFDVKNAHSIPYMWGTQGIGYRKSAVKGDIGDMGDMKWVLNSDRYSGRIAWFTDGVNMMRLALEYLGVGINATDKKAILEAEKLMSKQKKHVKVLTDDEGQDLLLSREIDVCPEWSGDISQAQREDNDIDYAIAHNGSSIWYDSLVIPKDTANARNAHAFLNYILDAEVGRDIAEYIGYATPNQAALKLTSKQYRDDPIQFPPASLVRKLPVVQAQDPSYYALVEESWKKVLKS